ncbi:MAG: NAD(P)H-dependent oxidoreductase [[Pasteurella] aerogenes]|nr:NAD(P)H-dependent oxidoreductase [[Pasteurella] aerogenes]
MTKVAVIIGSLSRKSIHRHIANQIMQFAPADIEVEEVKIDDLPIYTQDYDETSVPAYDRVRAQLKQADAVLIVTPEHNRTIPAATKNIIDIASRPYGQSIWTNKKVAIVSSSPSAYGGIVVGLELRKIFVFLGSDIMKREMYVSNGSLELSPHTTEFLKNFANDFYQWAK